MLGYDNDRRILCFIAPGMEVEVWCKYKNCCLFLFRKSTSPRCLFWVTLLPLMVSGRTGLWICSEQRQEIVHDLHMYFERSPGKWLLIYSTVEPFRSSPFFWAFQGKWNPEFGDRSLCWIHP